MTPRDIGAGIKDGLPSPTEGIQGWVSPMTPNAGLEDPAEASRWQRLRLRHFTASGCGVDLPVGAGVTSLAVVFERAEPDTNYGISLQVGWSTTVYVPAADKSTTGFTARFGTAAPGGGEFLSFSTFRSEDS
jgi:hypothetical protein